LEDICFSPHMLNMLVEKSVVEFYSVRAIN